MHMQVPLRPRVFFEAACDRYSENWPDLVEARKKRIIVACRSGNAGYWQPHTTVNGFENVISLKTGLKAA